jgi:hypothetical protein
LLSNALAFRDNAARTSRRNPVPVLDRVVALVCCTLLAGCTALHPRVERTAKKLECDGSRPCTVSVTVDCLRYVECDMRVDHDIVVVAGRNRPVDIQWKLSGEQGAEFAANGIAIDSSVFDCKPAGRDAFSCTDKHTDPGVFRYSVHVTVKNTLFGPRGVPSLDSWIVND